MGRLFREKPIDNSEYLPFVNTGLPIDMFNGKFVRGYDGRWYLYGGLSSTSAVQAGPQRFKSGYLLSNLVNAVARMPDTDCVVMDSEYSHEDRERIYAMSNRYLHDPVAREAHLADIRDRVKIINPSHDKARNLDAFIDYATEIAEDKAKHAKDWEIETPYIDPKTGKRQRMLLPTFMGIDSWSEASPASVEKRRDTWTEQTEVKDKRTIYMEEGWAKKTLMSQLPKLASKGGIYFFLSAHLANKVGMDGKPVKKDLQYMKQDEVAVGVSKQFYYLMSTLVQIDNAKVLTDPNDRRKCEFPLGPMTSPTELSELDMVLIRSKNNNSGNRMPFLSSQKFGSLGAMTDYNYLRTNGYFGLGSPNKAACVLLPKQPLPKTQIFKLSFDPKIARALQILSQLLFVQKNWSIRESEINFGINPMDLVDFLGKSGYASDDIVNSRDWWTTAKEPQPYLALPDIIEIAMGNYKPKFLKATPV